MSRPPIKAMKAVKKWCSTHCCNNPKTGFECPLLWCVGSVPRDWEIKEKGGEEK